jgi:long-chain acyl-CoA synthetase
MPPPAGAAHLYELVVERAGRYPRAVALGGQQGLRWLTFTSREVLERVDRLAAELQARGIEAGDRVVLWLPNHPWTPVYLFACWKVGAIVVPFDRDMNVEAAVKIVAATTPRLILTGYAEPPDWAAGGPAVAWWEPGAQGGVPAPSWTRPAEELATISYTSGTTGMPKGCMITHRNLLSQVEALGEILPLDPSCRLASILPLSHLFELTCGLLYPLSQGAAIHYVPSRRGPDIVRVLAEQRVSHMVVVPQVLTLMGQALDERLRAQLPGPLYRGLQAAAERLPLTPRRWLFWPVHRRLGGRLRLIASGGAALPPATHRLWERLGVRVVQGYGTSECSPVVAAGRPDGSTPVGSVGRPIRGVEVRLSPTGELLVRGPNVMRGYWQDPARTAAAFVDGWYATGDLAEIDAAGNIWLRGRASELIVLPNGQNVWPSDVEDVLRAHPAVKDAAVIPVPTPRGGMVLHAYLLRAEDAPASADPRLIAAAANARLAVHQRVATASWWPAADFPRTTTLKVRRHLLPLPAEAAGAAIPAPAPGDDPVRQAIASLAPGAPIAETATLGELGLDSLALVDLALALEEATGRLLSDEALALDLTVAQVRALVSSLPEAEAPVRPAYDEGGDPPLWVYRPLGRRLRCLGRPFDLLYRYGATKTIVLGGEHLRALPDRVVLAGTHHSFADLALVRAALRRTPARSLADRLVVPAAAWMVRRAGPLGLYAMVAFGLYPLRQYRDQAGSLRRLAQVAAEGNVVLFFPQGRHVPPAQERAGDPAAAFKPGVARIAQALDAVVVPFGLAGTEQVVLPTSVGFRGPAIAGIPLMIRRGPLAIAFGPPLKPLPGEAPAAFTGRLQAACFALTRQAEAALEHARRAPD